MKRTRALNLIVLFVLIASAFLATPRPAHAAVSITITTTKDDGVGCTLREAITAANTGAPFGDCFVYGLTDIILLPGQYKLSIPGKNENGNATGDLDITSNLTISGTGSSSTTGSYIMAEAGFGDRIIHVKSTGATKINVNFNKLTVKGGYAEVSPGGGGILVENANVFLYRTFITENNAGTNVTGGGVANRVGSSLIVNQSTFTLNNATFGGGIYNAGTMIIDNSLFDTNGGSQAGGGLDNSASTSIDVVIRNTTFVANSSIGGSAIANSGRLTVTNATIAKNRGVSAGVVINSGATLILRNTIIAGHEQGPNCTRLNSMTSSFVSNGYNLVDVNTYVPENPCVFGEKDLLGNPMLTTSVSDYDSPTHTFGFSSTDSPAIDAIPLGNTTCPLVIDQRLHGRGVDGDKDTAPGCDIGAYEEGGTLIRSFMPIMGR